MQRVKFTRTVSYNGTMYLRHTVQTLNETDLKALSGRYELVEKPKRADIPAPVAHTAVETPDVDPNLHVPTKKAKKAKRKG